MKRRLTPFALLALPLLGVLAFAGLPPYGTPEEGDAAGARAGGDDASRLSASRVSSSAAPAGAAGVGAFPAGPFTGDAPVAAAALRGDLAAVTSLLRGGADPNAALGDGMTALHHAAASGDAAMTEVLLHAGAVPAAVTRIAAHAPLHVAARAGHLPVVRALLAAGADARARTATGVTALHLAAGAGAMEVARALVDAGAEVDARESAAEQTPLMFAAAAGRVSVVRLLLARGAEPALTTRVVDFVARSEADGTARRQRARRVEAVREAEEETRRAYEALSTPSAELKGKDGEARGRDAGDEAPEAVRPAAPPAPPPGASPPSAPAPAARSAPDEDAPEPLSYADLVGRQGGMTALHYAAREGRAAAARALLEGGADLNQPTAGDRSTPLLVSVVNGHYDLALELLGRGADPNLASEDGAAPLFATLNNRWAPKALYPQPTAFKQQGTSYLELMEALLEAGADPDARLATHLWYTSFNFDLLGVDFGGATPFWRAAYATDVEAMKLLVAHGADPSVATKKPASRRRRGAENDASGLPPVPVGGPAVHPIHAASGVGYGQEFAANAHRHVPGGWLPAVRYLVEELGADPNLRDHDGYTPLHHAAARGDNELILYLVEKGADVTAVSRAGQTTVDMANGPQQRVQPFPETIALLEGLGAKNNHNCVSC